MNHKTGMRTGIEPGRRAFGTGCEGGGVCTRIPSAGGLRRNVSRHHGHDTSRTDSCAQGAEIKLRLIYFAI